MKQSSRNTEKQKLPSKKAIISREKREKRTLNKIEALLKQDEIGKVVSTIHRLASNETIAARLESIETRIKEFYLKREKEVPEELTDAIAEKRSRLPQPTTTLNSDNAPVHAYNSACRKEHAKLLKIPVTQLANFYKEESSIRDKKIQTLNLSNEQSERLKELEAARHQRQSDMQGYHKRNQKHLSSKNRNRKEERQGTTAQIRQLLQEETLSKKSILEIVTLINQLRPNKTFVTRFEGIEGLIETHFENSTVPKKIANALAKKREEIAQLPQSKANAKREETAPSQKRKRKEREPSSENDSESESKTPIKKSTYSLRKRKTNGMESVVSSESEGESESESKTAATKEPKESPKPDRKRKRLRRKSQKELEQAASILPEKESEEDFKTPTTQSPYNPSDNVTMLEGNDGAIETQQLRHHSPSSTEAAPPPAITDTPLLDGNKPLSAYFISPETETHDTRVTCYNPDLLAEFQDTIIANTPSISTYTTKRGMLPPRYTQPQQPIPSASPLTQEPKPYWQARLVEQKTPEKPQQVAQQPQPAIPAGIQQRDAAVGSEAMNFLTGIFFGTPEESWQAAVKSTSTNPYINKRGI